MRIKKNYLTLLAITLAVIILCFMLPSALFQFYDTEWTEKRVEKSANVSGLNIDSMSLSEKIQLIYNLDTIEAALNGETDTSLEVAVLSRGYKLTKEEAWSNIITEFMKLADGLETLMPEFYKYIAHNHETGSVNLINKVPMMIKARLTDKTTLVCMDSFFH